MIYDIWGILGQKIDWWCQFHHLTYSWPSNPIWRPAAILKIAFSILWSPVPCDLCFVGVFGGKEIIYDVSLMIRLGLNLQMQDDHHVANGLCKLWSHRTVRFYDFVSILDQTIEIFKFEIVHATHLNLLTLLTQCHHHYRSHHCSFCFRIW